MFIRRNGLYGNKHTFVTFDDAFNKYGIAMLEEETIGLTVMALAHNWDPMSGDIIVQNGELVAYEFKPYEKKLPK